MYTPIVRDSLVDWCGQNVIRKVANSASTILILCMAALALPESSKAAPAKLLSYQGRITDNNGQPVADGSYSIRFKIYGNNTKVTAKTNCEADSGTDQLWTETLGTTQVTNGLFSVVLGETATLTGVDFDLGYHFIQVKVGANPIFTPCDQLTTSPYAIRAIDANSASTATNASACSVDGTCETQTVDASATGSTFLGRIGVEGNTGISCAGVATGTSGIWYADAADCGTVFVGLNSATNGSEVWGIWIGNWDWTIDAAGNVSQGGNLTVGGDLTVSGMDIDLLQGATSYIHSVGRISFDWTAGTYDDPEYHGLTSKNEAQVFADSLRINSYSDIINTIDTNANSVSYFKVQKESVGNGTDLLTIDESGNTTLLGDLTVTGGDITGNASSATTASNSNACSADATCETQAISASGNLTVTGGTTTLNNGTSNLINFGSVGVAAPSAASAGWKIKTYGNNYGLGIEGSTQWFSTGQYYRFYNSDGSTYWKKRIEFDTNNAITYPAVYAYDNAGAPAATLLEFKTGMYNNGGTFYSQNQIYARGGIANDSADLTLNDTVDVTGGDIEVDGNVVIDDGAGWHRTYNNTGWYNGTWGGGWYMTDATYVRTYSNKSIHSGTGGYYRYDGSADQPIIKYIAYGIGTTSCPTGWKVVSCNGGNAYCTAYNMGHEGAFCSNFEPPHDCPSSGSIICVYAP